MTNKLPAPDPIAQQYSDQLLALIKQKIAENGGKITFADYMQYCLYSPGLGYYSAGSHKIGAHGDFTTAPEISSLFSASLSQHIKDVFSQIDQKNILEFGAGSGKMAANILIKLDQDRSLPTAYYIIEASADLRQRQENTMKEQAPHLINKVIWLESLPEEFIGVVLANEVCDAMPVHCLHFSNGNVTERYVENNGRRLDWCEDIVSKQELLDDSATIQTIIGSSNVISEINIAAKAWLASVANSLKQGAIYIIDYGYPKASYYHPQRSHGTLMCYYQQQGHDNPLILQGIQDITAHVDFTALAQIAIDNSLDVEGFQSQADFLLAADITQLVSETDQIDTLTYLQHTAEIKRLTLPSEMGETFKVLTLGRNIEHILTRCQLGDRRYSL